MATRTVKTKFEIDGESAYKSSLQNINASLSKLAAGFAAVTAAVAAVVEGYQKLIDMTTEMASEADNILTLTQITGFDSESIQQIQYASELIDVSFETIQGSMKKMKKSLDDVKDGTGDVAEAYEKLGVAVTDSEGNFRNSEDIFYDLIDALGEVENATERDNLSMEIFGKSAEDLNPLIIQGTDTLKKYAAEAENVGYVLGEEDLAALGAVDDAYQRMQNTQEAVTKQLSAEMAPAVEDLYTTWTDFMQKAGKALIDSGIIDNLAGILEDLVDLISTVSTINNDTIPATEEKLSGLQEALNYVAQVIAHIRDLADAVSIFFSKGIFNSDFWNALGFGYSSGTPNNLQTTKMKQSGDWEYYSEYYGLNASGDSNWRGGLTWVGENGAELVNLPQGSQIYTAQESREIAGGDTYNITIDAKSVKEFDDIVRIAQNSRMTARAGGVG